MQKEKIVTICFPKGLKKNYEAFNNFVKPNGINLDAEIDPFGLETNSKMLFSKGLNPKILFEKDENMLKVATKYIKTLEVFHMFLTLGMVYFQKQILIR